MSIGIYSIRNKINDKIYIGQSLNIEKRLHEHMRKSSNLELRKDIERLGLNNFEFTILHKCNKDKLDLLERKYIRDFQKKGLNVYNVSLTDERLKKANSIDDTIKEFELVYIKDNTDYLINKYGQIYSKKQYKFISTYSDGREDIVSLSNNGIKKIYKVKNLIIEAFGENGEKIILEKEKENLKELLEDTINDIKDIEEELKIIEAKYKKLKANKKVLIDEIDCIDNQLKNFK